MDLFPQISLTFFGMTSVKLRNFFGILRGTGDGEAEHKESAIPANYHLAR